MKSAQWLLVGGGAALFLGGLAIGRLAPGTSAQSQSRQGEDAKFSLRGASGGSGYAAEEGSEGSATSSLRSAGVSFSVGDILLQGDPGSRFEMLLSTLERSDGEDFVAMLEEIGERGFNDVMREERVLIISAWAKRDPVAAALYLKENNGGDRLQFAAMSTWASNDPEAALAWARENHTGEGANDWLVGVIRGIAGTDPSRAAGLMSELPRSREQWRAMESTMPFVMDQGSDFARTWIETLEGEGLQSNGAEWMARRMAAKSPEDAASWISSLGTKEARREASEEVALRYAALDLDKAQSWVKSLPQDTRTEAAEGVVTFMAKDDPRAAVAWLEKLGDDPDYDGAWVDLVERGFRAEPGVALVGALRLSDEGWREKYTNNYLSKWMKDDKEAAQQWVKDYTEYLPPRVARRFVPKPPKPPKQPNLKGNKVSFLDMR